VARRLSPDVRRQRLIWRRRILFTWLAFGVVGAAYAATRPGDPAARCIRALTALFLGPLFFAALAAGVRL
jgi:hypothetical protein